MTKKIIFLISITLLTSTWCQGQRGVRIGVIDMDYILSNMKDYQEANEAFENQANTWRESLEQKQKEIDEQQEAFDIEKPLLTPQLIEDREDELAYEREQLEALQQKLFGPQGDWMTQQKSLLEPVQDQILSLVREIATNRKYDFVFDRTSDVFLLYSEKKHDISDLVLKRLKRSEKLEERNEALKEREETSEGDDSGEEAAPNPALEARKQAIEDKKKQRAEALEQRRLEIERKKAEKKEAYEKRRKEQLEAREAKKKKKQTEE